ncbi:hypothetical protein PG999_009895 [Apiospora kogelbergensis]|uniref:Cytochrome P450 n=1 Tax=Apiospora kogelbergensis TaxID=1337665 RepID=A0AAW0QU64_9PEZI
MALKSLVNVSHAGLLFNDDWTRSEVSHYARYFITAALFLVLIISRRERYPNLPRLNPKKGMEFTWRARLLDYMGRSRELLSEGTRQFADKPYKLYTELGDILVVPNKYAEELKSVRALDFSESASDATHGYVPGLNPFTTEPGFIAVIQNYLTKALVSLTAPISLEASKALRDVFTDSKEWKEVTPDDIMLVVSRMSSRIFMGEELCNDEEWIRESAQYVSAAFQGIFELSQWPRAMRPVVHWFLPRFGEIRQRLRRCRAVLQPHVDRRLAAKAAAGAGGGPTPRYNDSIEWFARELRPDHDPTNMQLSLTLVAVHTTTDLLTQTMMDIAKHPEILGPLREEAVSVLRSDGLKKSAFQKLRLMDACFKESQRLRPVMLAYFRRFAKEDVKLQDGFVIKKGTQIAMDGRAVLLNEADYPEPLRWDPYRFLRMRETAGGAAANKAHLVSASDKHVGFGHGIHACPGRFFAANELKVALAHVLLKYDWKLPTDATDLPPTVVGSSYMLPYGVKFLVARRQEELDMDAMEC